MIAKFPDAMIVANRLANFTPPKKAVVEPLEADKVKVRVVNGSGMKGVAGQVLDTFTAAGFQSAGPAGGRRPQRLPHAGALRAGQVPTGLHGRRRGRHPEPRSGRVGEATRWAATRC